MLEFIISAHLSPWLPFGKGITKSTLSSPCPPWEWSSPDYFLWKVIIVTIFLIRSSWSANRKIIIVFSFNDASLSTFSRKGHGIVDLSWQISRNSWIHNSMRNHFFWIKVWGKSNVKISQKKIWQLIFFNLILIKVIISLLCHLPSRATMM